MLSREVLPSLLAVAAFLPPSFYLWSVASFDRRSEPAAAVIGTFVLGAVAAILLNSLIAPVADTAFGSRDMLVATCLRTFWLVSAPEEAAKFVVLIAVARRFMAPDNPMSGVTFGAAVGLGFAAAENVGYLLVNVERWTSVAFVRSVVTVPVHGVLGIIAGVYVARARAAAAATGRRATGHRIGSYAAALVIPVLLHAAYDFPFALTRACEDPDGAAISALKALGLAVGLAIVAVGTSITFRLAGSRDPAFEPRCLSPYLLRAPWRKFLLGSLAALLGLLILAAEVSALLYGAEFSRDRALVLLVAPALLLLTARLHFQAWRQQKNLQNSDKSQSPNI
ncbi:PrsW family glutamic-type intramembrane protease [Thalassobaculum sp.]|uniref:PrsW family intramembrane metalloprotease n=1 Tax=Thalassobaculum sp. TaxID=2022740 RepID=UPI0032EAE99E